MAKLPLGRLTSALFKISVPCVIVWILFIHARVVIRESESESNILDKNHRVLSAIKFMNLNPDARHVQHIAHAIQQQRPLSVIKRSTTNITTNTRQQNKTTKGKNFGSKLAQNEPLSMRNNTLTGSYPPGAIHISTLAFNPKYTDILLVSIKSTLLFSSRPVHFHIFYKSTMLKMIEKKKHKALQCLEKLFHYTAYELDSKFAVEYIGKTNMRDFQAIWLNSKPQSYFMWSKYLTDVDSVMVFDADVLLLTDVANIHNFITKFNESQLMGMSPSDARYWKFNNTVPWPRPIGNNAGVFIANLTKWRNQNMWQQLATTFNAYHKFIGSKHSEQNWLNIHLGLHPEQRYQMPCGYNFHPGIDACIWGNPKDYEVIRKSVCTDIYTDGIAILHGTDSVGSFNKINLRPGAKFYGYALIYDAIERFDVRVHNVQNFWNPIYKKYTEDRQTYEKKKPDCHFPGNARNLMNILKTNVLSNLIRWTNLCKAT